MLRILIYNSLKLSLITGIVFSILVDVCLADKLDHGRARLSRSAETEASLKFKVSPVSLSDGSLITLITPDNWLSLGNRLTRTLVDTHKQFSEDFGELQPINTSLRILPESLFFETTGAPYWTNALFYKGQIFIPLSKEKEKDEANLIRSAKHEYVHAILHGLSAGRAPGWLDEGLAQLSEGEENPVLRPSLLRYLKKNPAIPLSRLQGGFTRLGTESVAPAYAQSLIISIMLKKNYGLKTIRTYFDYLRNGEDAKLAFNFAFGISQARFEDLISKELAEWTSDF